MSFLLQIGLIVASPFILIALLCAIQVIKGFAKGKKKQKFNGVIEKQGILQRLLVDFPKQFANDFFVLNPNHFNVYGFHLICGVQGSGKTVTLVYLLNKYQKQFPKMKVRTNFHYTKQDGEIIHYNDLILNHNGEYGQIDVIDEVQNWFCSNNSKDFPIEMIQEITQQRKQRKALFGTSQVFGRVAKPIREQVQFLYLPITIAGCLTIVRVFRPTLDESGKVIEKKRLKTFFFIHNEEIRNSFDTYKKIEQLSNAGFTPRFDNQTNDINLNFNKTKKKIK